jgi:hypothetical protein
VIAALIELHLAPRLYGRGEAEADGEVEGDGEAEGEAGDEALAGGDADGDAVGEAVVAGTVRSRVSAEAVASGVASEPVCPVRSSRDAKRNVERVMAATIAPKSTTGASAAVKGNNVHGELPTGVRPRTR